VSFDFRSLFNTSHEDIEKMRILWEMEVLDKDEIYAHFSHEELKAPDTFSAKGMTFTPSAKHASFVTDDDPDYNHSA
jgi:hypothetical protein